MPFLKSYDAANAVYFDIFMVKFDLLTSARKGREEKGKDPNFSSPVLQILRRSKRGYFRMINKFVDGGMD